METGKFCKSGLFTFLRGCKTKNMWHIPYVAHKPKIATLCLFPGKLPFLGYKSDRDNVIRQSNFKV